MTKLRFCLLAAALAMGLGCGRAHDVSEGRPAAVEAARPNVLLVSLDTLRADHLGCLGYRKGTTPNLDRLAGEGALFTSCRAQAPWTLPSHMALFTSLRPTDNGVDGLNKVLPGEVPTLAEVLRGAGYRTAGLVNDGQMKRHWGFARGFQTWREFPAGTPAGACPHLTAEALAWLKGEGGKGPFFLFLHYFDAHDPYAAPEPYRRRTGTTLTAAEAHRLCLRYRTPGHDLRDGALLADLVAAYDAGVSWLDDEVGKLLAAVPPNTLVVVFADHGEAFEEHGWTMHGATLYEEELRVPLIVRPPGPRPPRPVVGEPVMLLDVAPTVLARCGVRAPAAFQGADLAPLWDGGRLPARLIPAETKAVLEGRYCLALTAYPLKGIYSLFDGRFELYRLPDEHRDLAAAEPAAAQALLRPLREWMEGEQFWMLHAAGAGDYEATVEAEGGFGLFLAAGADPERDDLDVRAGGRVLRWHVYPDGGRPKSLFLQPARPGAALRVDFRINGAAERERVFLGKDGRHPEALPATVPAGLAPVSPFLERPFAAARPGFYLLRHRGRAPRPRPARVERPDEKTLRRLRSLGYVR